MITRAHGVALRVMLVVAGSVLGFALCEARYRGLEADASVYVVRLLAGKNSCRVFARTQISIFAEHRYSFRAIITPSCSATASIITLGCLSSLSPRFGRWRRSLATALAIAMVALGNILRISLSVLVGVHQGISSLVLFHDWVGGVMTFVYTLGGYVLMLTILLPRRQNVADDIGANLVHV